METKKQVLFIRDILEKKKTFLFLVSGHSGLFYKERMEKQIIEKRLEIA